MTRAYALYRGRSLLVFADAEQRQEYIQHYAKFDPPHIISAGAAERWQPSSPNSKTMYVWRDAGRWQIKGFFGKVLKTAPEPKAGSETKEGDRA